VTCIFSCALRLAEWNAFASSQILVSWTSIGTLGNFFSFSRKVGLLGFLSSWLGSQNARLNHGPI
jgi:hypothetical protein